MKIKKIQSLFFLFITAISIHAQSDCERMLNAAIEDYYNKGKYEQAAKMFRSIQSDCGTNYGGTSEYLRKCNAKLQENADYKKCSTIEACNYYLKTYPNGRFVSKVQQNLAELLLIKEEDEAYEKCQTEIACQEYLEQYPNGRFVPIVQKRLAKILFLKEEDEAYEKCQTVVACQEYLEKYPDGRYVEQVEEKIVELDRLWREEYNAFYSCTTEDACMEYLKKYPAGEYVEQVKKKKAELERLRKEKEAAKTAYMKIIRIEFANVDKQGDIIDPYGSTLFASEMKYLKPKIIYDGILDDTKKVLLYCKIFSPNGTLESGENSPSGYTYSNSYWVWPGRNNSILLDGWGNSTISNFTSGKYTLELWFEGVRIYQTTIAIKDKENALSRGDWRIALKKSREHVTTEYGNSIYKGQQYDGFRSGLGMYVYESGSFYIGRWSSGNRNGLGMYVPKTGNIMNNCPDCAYFYGEWSDGLKSGTGSCYDKMGNLIYYGNFENDAPTQTYPTTGYKNYKFECYEFSNGDFYVGETLNGKSHGTGIYIWSSGDMWYGTWSDGQRNGYGIYMSYEGVVSTGKWIGNTKQ